MGIPEDEMTVKVREAIMTLMQEVEFLRRDLSDAQNRLDKMEKLADQDPLIPVANRRAFVREVSRMISFAERYEVSSSVIYIDVNNMKTVNDELGHNAGDAVLMHVGMTLQKNVRDLDTVGRLGGDEFGVILAQSNDDQAHERAEALVKKVIENPAIYEGKEIPVDVAYGTYTFGGDMKAAEALAEADRIMYENKRQKKELEE
jgi:diguanylate cyclase (GGDEF)-like protein